MLQSLVSWVLTIGLSIGVGIVIIAVITMLLMPFALIWSLYRIVTGMLAPGAGLQPIEPEEFPDAMEDAANLHHWCEVNGYQWMGAYENVAPKNPRSFVALWALPDAHRFIALYHVYAGQITSRDVDVVTRFDESRSLTTNMSADGMLLPKPPGQYAQCAPDVSISELHRRHLETERRLSPAGPMPAPGGISPAELVEHFDDTVRKEGEYVRSHALWPVRGIWWYLTRKRRANRPAA